MCCRWEMCWGWEKEMDELSLQADGWLFRWKLKELFRQNLREVRLERRTLGNNGTGGTTKEATEWQFLVMLKHQNYLESF